MKKIIVAVSGGVDSVTMLDTLARDGSCAIIVVHVDHGIRHDSMTDARFVEQLVAHYDVPFESLTLSLGPGASEAIARDARWTFLRDMKAKHAADAIATAHHADDIVETIIINLLRGTGWRGIATLRATDEIMRPLANMRKAEIIAYAQDHGLAWREDGSNATDSYLRNRIRRHVMPRLDRQQFEALLSLHRSQVGLRSEIEAIVDTLPMARSRHDYVMSPDGMARELLRHIAGSLTRAESDRTLLFIRTAKVGKALRLTNGKRLMMAAAGFIVLESEDC